MFQWLFMEQLELQLRKGVANTMRNCPVVGCVGSILRNLLSHLFWNWHWFSKIPLVTAIHHPKKKPDSQSVRMVHVWVDKLLRKLHPLCYQASGLVKRMLLASSFQTRQNLGARSMKNSFDQKLWISGRKDLSTWKVKAHFGDWKMAERFSNGKTGKAVTWWFCQGSETRSWWLLSLASWICWSPGCSCIEKSSTKAFSFKSMLIPFVHF